MTQETSRPHILHLDSLVIPWLLGFSISLSLYEKKPKAPTSSPPRFLRRTTCSSTPSLWETYAFSDPCFSSLFEHFLSSILCEQTRSQHHRRLSSPVLASTASTIKISGFVCSLLSVSLDI